MKTLTSAKSKDQNKINDERINTCVKSRPKCHDKYKTSKHEKCSKSRAKNALKMPERFKKNKTWTKPKITKNTKESAAVLGTNFGVNFKKQETCNIFCSLRPPDLSIFIIIIFFCVENFEYFRGFYPRGFSYIYATGLSRKLSLSRFYYHPFHLILLSCVYFIFHIVKERRGFIAFSLLFETQTPLQQSLARVSPLRSTCVHSSVS